MNIYTGLGLVVVVPFLFVLFLPKNSLFFQKKSIAGFGLGVYTALILLLLKEGVEHTVVATSIWFGVGFLISVLIGMLFKGFHHHHSDADLEKHNHSKIDSIKILLSDFFHNIVDGISLISAFATGGATGITSLFGILGHQTIQQAGQQVLLVDTGISTKKALSISFSVSLSIFLGFIFYGNEIIENIFISLSAGIILWKVITDIKEMKWTKEGVFGFMIGGMLLTASLLLFPHTH